MKAVVCLPRAQGDPRTHHYRGELLLWCPKCGNRDAAPDWFGTHISCSNDCGGEMAIDPSRQLMPGHLTDTQSPNVVSPCAAQESNLQPID